MKFTHSILILIILSYSNKNAFASLRIFHKVFNNRLSTASSITSTQKLFTHTINYIVSPGGTAFPVPYGANKLTPVINSSNQQRGVALIGKFYQMRIMNPLHPKDKRIAYPHGYIKYENFKRQGIDIYTGKTLSNNDSHHPIDISH